jgi:Na+/H+ antiporter NhaD/arsenite permease-like protein
MGLAVSSNIGSAVTLIGNPQNMLIGQSGHLEFAQFSLEIMGLVDWHLITLFCALFVIIHGVSQGPYLGIAMDRFSNMGMDLHKLPVLTGVSAVLSNFFSNDRKSDRSGTSFPF